jgi:cell division protein FtsI/penicillin-binding protein 2
MPRVSIGFSIISGVFILIICKLFYWQVISGESLRVQAEKQYFLEFSLPASRGAIRASDGSPLVINSPAYLAYAQPKKIKNPFEFVTQISKYIAVDTTSLLSQITADGRIWVPIAHKVDAPIVDALRSLQLDGLDFEQESKRYYPESSMAAHLLGFVGSDQNGYDKGYFGLEGFYDRELRGIEGFLQREKDAHGAPIVIGEEKRIDAENGRTFILWLDRVIQRSVELRLLEGIAKYGAKAGSVVVMDPKTGGILAMASVPSYDPSHFSDFDKNVFVNPIVGSSYEPGSTFKVLVMAAALNLGVIEATTQMDEDGPTKVGGYSIRTWDNNYRGKQSMSEVIQHSSNVGMVFIQQKMGRDPFLRFLHDFGFGKASGIDLEEDQSPELRPDKEWKEIDLATASFGQGIAVTPIQMVRAVSAIANGGFLMEPKLLRKTVDSKGKEIEIPPSRGKRLLSKKSTDLTTEMMINAVDNGEAKWAKPKGYRIAGKTGTAQIPVEGHYDEKKTIASFVGFAPADDPQFVMLVTLREPTSSQWGSETAAPLFFSIAKDIFLYKGIAPQL